MNAMQDPARARRTLALLVALVLAWPMLVLAEFKPWTLFDERALQVTGRYLAQFFPPRMDAGFLAELAHETWRTVAIATAGMALALVIAVPAALVATSRLSASTLEGRPGPARWLRRAVRAVLVGLRSIPELVWALVFVRVVGLGPTSGVLAIAIAYGGMLGKVYAEILESADPAPTQALLRGGSSRLQALLFGALPSCLPELLSYTVYRWECAVRSSVVLGFVGAGGLGQLLDSASKMFSGSEVSSILLVFIALVMASDAFSRWLRNQLDVAPAQAGAASPASWPRFSSVAVGLGLLALVACSFVSLDLQWAAFLGPDALGGMGRFVASFFPPEMAPPFLAKTGWALLETLAMSALGTALAVLGGLLLALPAAGTGVAREAARFVLNVLRSVPELVWAVQLLILAGLGPLPGTLALALHTSGVLGRLFAEAFENAPSDAALALRQRGLRAARVWLFATLPQTLPQLASYTLYRWENNIRAASIMGVVGAGGLGQMLSYHLGLFQMHEACTVLIAMVALVALVDALSWRLRRHLTQ
ncbi:phosphonate ABC transporter, permease protein PhnE [Pelomonas cellulosilytica]|uniref:Phosphonate ABC transporter, permease protein PhnE n=1 Tax=Pelomonas cellulosilytica TaxID=2906762 RepID=A0ABS8XT71_9BURK|nr:phosphonate ABC transporter, permease protein PhnE [Pelomonas sp. P8]MCE4554500.1 phosphonate ABC transporter, permease protein PhnE [Pelomonas sp. P8]